MSAVAKALDAYETSVQRQGFAVVRDAGGSLAKLSLKERDLIDRFPSPLRDLYHWSNGAWVEKDGAKLPFGLIFEFSSLSLTRLRFDQECLAVDESKMDEIAVDFGVSNAILPFFDANDIDGSWYGYSRGGRKDEVFSRTIYGFAEATGLSLAQFLESHRKVLFGPELGLINRFAEDANDPIVITDFSLAFEETWVPQGNRATR